MAKLLYVNEVHAFLTKSLPPMLSIQVVGTAPTTGWTDGRLEAHTYEAPPADGILDFDIVATPPSGAAGKMLTPVNASVAVFVPTWVKGVRVHSSNNSVEQGFDERSALEPVNYKADLGYDPVARDPGDTWPWKGNQGATDALAWLIAAPKADTQALLTKLGARSLNEGRIGDLVGKPYRIVREGDVVDMSYQPDRVTIVVARDQSVIADVKFG